MLKSLVVNETYFFGPWNQCQVANCGSYTLLMFSSFSLLKKGLPQILKIIFIVANLIFHMGVLKP